MLGSQLLMTVHFKFVRQRKLIKDFEWVNIGAVNRIAFSAALLISVNFLPSLFFCLKFSCHGHLSVKSPIFILRVVSCAACIRNVLFRYLDGICY